MTQQAQQEIVPPGWLAKRNKPTQDEVVRQCQLVARHARVIVQLWRSGADTFKIASRVGCQEYAVDMLVHNPRLWPTNA